MSYHVPMSTSVELLDPRAALRNLNDQLQQCDNGEGTACSNLEQSIRCHVEVCAQMLNYTRQWANRIFSGQIAFSSESEALFKKEIGNLTNKAKSVAAHGMEMNGVCFQLEQLGLLGQYIVYF